MAIFNSNVKLPEGTLQQFPETQFIISIYEISNKKHTYPPVCSDGSDVTSLTIPYKWRFLWEIIYKWRFSIAMFDYWRVFFVGESRSHFFPLWISVISGWWFQTFGLFMTHFETTLSHLSKPHFHGFSLWLMVWNIFYFSISYMG